MSLASNPNMRVSPQPTQDGTPSRHGVPAQPTALAVVTRRIAPVADLHTLLEPLAAREALSWVRRGEGMVGVAGAWQVTTHGTNRMADADTRWRALVVASAVDDEVGLRGTGLIAFGSFSFHDGSPVGGTLVVPRFLIGQRDGTSWVTLVRPVPEDCDSWETLAELRGEADAVTGRGSLPSVDAFAALAGLPLGADRGVGATGPVAPRVLREEGATLSEGAFHDAVDRSLKVIDSSELAKIVLSRSVRAHTEEPVDVRYPLRRLAETYPTTWTFAVDGIVGATPELLVRRDKGLAAARVLAGTVPNAPGEQSTTMQIAEALAESSKNLAEHEFAVRSLVHALEPYCASMNVPDQPFVLRLPNVMHLASDVTGAVRTVDGIAPSSLVLAEALHPTAAVGGTPTPRAVELIREFEGADRGRYAGPVGWLDAEGDGEWGIALRCGVFEAPNVVRLHAGCGIVPGSDPGTEFAESEAKLAPMRGALR